MSFDIAAPRRTRHYFVEAGEVIARRIIDIAPAGERDPEAMCKQALAAFGIDRIG